MFKLIFQFTEEIDSYNINECLDCAVQQNNVDMLELLFVLPKFNPAQVTTDTLCHAVKFDSLQVIKRLLLFPHVDTRTNKQRVIEYAVENNKVGTLPEIHELFGLSSSDYTKSLFIAAEQGYINIVRFLIESVGCDPSIAKNSAFCMAAANGHDGIMRYLLQFPNVKPNDDYNYALRGAARAGHTHTVQYLLQLPGVDPTAQNCEACSEARRKGHRAIVKLLKAHSK